MKTMRITALTLVAALFTSCSTSYDTYGNRKQSVDPGAAAIGAVALGAIAYSVGKDRGKRKEHQRHTRPKYDYPSYGYGRPSYGHGHNRGNQRYYNSGYRR